MTNKFYINFLFILVGFYCFMVVLGKLSSSKSEIYPFFDWSLYSSAPQNIEKHYIDIYKNQSSNEKIDFYDYTKNKIGSVTARNNLLKLKYCHEKSCFTDVKNRILSLLPVNSYAVFYSIDENNQIDTLGYFYDSKFKFH